jgi:hypothetical protein
MNVQLLIDAIVRQTTVLIAELATAGGARAPLAHVANQVFLELARELDRQGVSRKVSADMFGLALRSYQRKIARLRESSTVRGRSLWEAVFDFLVERGEVTRAEVLTRFDRDDEELVAGVLHDLTDSGVVFASGRGPSTEYRVAARSELDDVAPDDAEGADALVWTLVYREGPLSRASLSSLTTLVADRLDGSLSRLEDAGRITAETVDAAVVYRSSELVISLDAKAGWEAAVFDHFQALVKTVTSKLRRDPPGDASPELVGGSTYTFVVWPGHPYFDAVSGELADYRRRRSELRASVDAFNASAGIPPRHQKFVSYAGQCVIVEDDRGEII